MSFENIENMRILYISRMPYNHSITCHEVRFAHRCAIARRQHPFNRRQFDWLWSLNNCTVYYACAVQLTRRSCSASVSAYSSCASSRHLGCIITCPCSSTTFIWPSSASRCTPRCWRCSNSHLSGTWICYATTDGLQYRLSIQIRKRNLFIFVINYRDVILFLE